MPVPKPPPGKTATTRKKVEPVPEPEQVVDDPVLAIATMHSGVVRRALAACVAKLGCDIESPAHTDPAVQASILPDGTVVLRCRHHLI